MIFLHDIRLYLNITIWIGKTLLLSSRTTASTSSNANSNSKAETIYVNSI
jgi:hypothetical protein